MYSPFGTLYNYKELLFVDYNTAELVILAVYRYKVSTAPPSITI